MTLRTIVTSALSIGLTPGERDQLSDKAWARQQWEVLRLLPLRATAARNSRILKLKSVCESSFFFGSGQILVDDLIVLAVSVGRGTTPLVSCIVYISLTNL
jgi:hypothetical protein